MFKSVNPAEICVSDERGERFHHELKSMEQRYHGLWNNNMMGDYIRFLRITADKKYAEIIFRLKY